MNLFVSPHNDDAVLFGAFTLMRERCAVLTVFDSYIQVARGHLECTQQARREEDLRAISSLGCVPFFAGVSDAEPEELAYGKVLDALSQWRDKVEQVWLPEVAVGGHAQHNLVGEAGLKVFAGKIIKRYLTYTRVSKCTGGLAVPVTGKMVRRKLQALAFYRTQIEIDALGCWPHFLRDQTEYLAR